MRKYLLFLFGLFILQASAQFQDDFSDGNITANPVWIGDTDSFEVTALNQLHLNAPANTEESYLSVASLAAVDGYWEFYVDLDFNPSGSNRAYVYLMSDQSNLEGALNGYFVLIGSGDDEVSLYRQDGIVGTKLIDGVNGTVGTTPKVKIKVTRDLLGNFELFSDTSATLTNSLSEGTAFDNTYLSSAFFGVLCDYTSTRSDKFWFDDFDVTAQQYVDVFPPTVTNFEILNTSSLRLTFSEDLTTLNSENNTNYSVNNSIGNPSSSVWNAVDKTVTLNFSNTFQSGISYTLSANNIEDLNLNSLDTIIAFELENAYAFEEIIFNEIMADETPSFGLPAFEFIEFKNLTSDTLFTDGWFLSDFTDTTFFNVDTILPDEYVIVGKTTAVTFYDSFGKTFGLTSFISLNKTEDLLTLYDQYGNVLDSLHYFDDWFAGELAPNGTDKVDGGWSLERILDNFPCSASMNWFPSSATLGGSPGSLNTVLTSPGSIAPTIISASFIDDTTIQILFDQEVTGALDITNYELSSLDIDVITIEQINSVSGSGTTYFIYIENAANLNYTYSLLLSNIQNCSGVPLFESSIDVFFVKTPVAGDIVINEILSNPYTGGDDYIEIFNTTQNALNLSGVSFIEYDIDFEDDITDFSTPFTEEFVLPPNAYYTFSEDTETVFLNYIVNQPNWLFEQNIPNLDDKESIIAIVLNDSIVLDKLHYYSRWNFDLLDTDNGVALERISIEGETQDDSNWASAAAGFGYGTPTAKNSQSFPEIAQEDLVQVSPEVFTPNQDGNDDFTLISYTIDEPGYVANVAIFDVVGRKIKDLATKETIGTKGFWKWDGTNYNQEKAKTGIYVVLVDLFDIKGKKKHFEKTVVLGTQF